MTIETAKIIIPGLKRNYTFFQISDAHVAYAADDAPEEIKERAKYFTDMWTRRARNKYTPIEALEEVIEYVNGEEGDALFNTGDFFEGRDGLNNVDFYHHFVESCNKEILYVPGNHETPTWDIPPKLVQFMRGNGMYWVREYEDLLIVGLNNNKREFSEEQLTFLKEQMARNLPILLLMHIPIYTEACDEVIRKQWGENGHEQYSIGLDRSSPECKAVVELLKQEGNNIAAIIVGHAHLAHVGEFAPGRLQFITEPCFNNFIRRFELSAE